MKRKLEIAAASKGMTLADYCLELIRHGTQSIELTHEDIQRIAQEEEQARKGQTGDGRKRARGTGGEGGRGRG